MPDVDIKNIVRIFNIRYGVNFSISEYKKAITKAVKQARAAGGDVDEVAIQCNVYKDTIKRLYRTMALNACKNLNDIDSPAYFDENPILEQNLDSRSSVTIENKNEPILSGNYSMDGIDYRDEDDVVIQLNPQQSRQNKKNYRKEIDNRDAKYIVELDEDLFGFGLLNEFNRAFLIPYLKTEQGKNLLLTNPYEELSEEEKAQAIYDGVKEFKNNPLSLYQELYASGQLRIRDMRSYVESLTKDTYREESMAKGFQLVQMLKNINESRSFWWRLFHPFRNNAEQRDAAKMEAMMTKHIIATEGKSNPEDAQANENGESVEERNKALVERYKEMAKTYTPLQSAFEELEEELPDNESVDEDEKSVDESVIKGVEVIEEVNIIQQPQEKPDYSYEDAYAYITDNDNKYTIQDKINDFYKEALQDSDVKVTNKERANAADQLYKRIVQTTQSSGGDISRVAREIFDSALSYLMHYDNSKTVPNNDGYLIPNAQALMDAQILTDKILGISILSQSPKSLEDFKGYTINHDQKDLAIAHDKNEEEIQEAADQYNRKHKKIVNEKKEHEEFKERISIKLDDNKEVQISQQIKEGVINNSIDKSFHQ